MIAHGVKISKIGAQANVFSVEDSPKQLALGLSMMLASALDAFKAQIAIGDTEAAAEIAASFMASASRVWPHRYGTLQQLTKYVANDLGFEIEEVHVGKGGTV